jgi:hypothetical protein
LPDGAGGFKQDFSGPALLRILLGHYCLRVRGFHSFRRPSHTVPLRVNVTTPQSYNPETAVTASVWASPRSLATTCGITIVFSSYAYLDVSVQRVRLPRGMSCLLHDGLTHSETSGSVRICRSPELIAAYRVLLRL